jgi:energy-coupling factor transporter ATP-binding protein EcfA2
MVRNYPFLKLLKDKPKTAARYGVMGIRLEECLGYEIRGKNLGENLVEQIDLINSLHTTQTHRIYELRYLIHPNRDNYQLGKVDIVFLAKIDVREAKDIKEFAQESFLEINALINGRLSGYNFVPITTEVELDTFLNPFEIKEIAEIRRREELIKLDRFTPTSGIGYRPLERKRKQENTNGIYLTHSFSPTPHTFSQLFKILLLTPDSIVFSITLAPTSLSPDEIEFLINNISITEDFLAQPSSATETHKDIYRQRALLINKALTQQYHLLSDAPFQMRIQVCSSGIIPLTILEAVGVEITNPIGSQDDSMQSGGYDCVYPERNLKEYQVALHNFQNLEFNDWGESKSPVNSLRLRQLVDAYEANCAFRLPIPLDDELPGLDISHCRTVAPPRDILLMENSKEPAVKLGINRTMGQTYNLFLSDSDRKQHLYIIGQTGTGKTTLMKSMALDDMNNGKGVIVIDPHGDMYHELLESVPEHRLKDLVLFDPTDSDYPLGFNPLEMESESQRDFIIREFKSIMERILQDQYGDYSRQMAGPMFYTHTQMNLRVILNDWKNPGTLLDLYEIFNQKDYWIKYTPLEYQDTQANLWIKNTLSNTDYTRFVPFDGYVIGDFYKSKFIDFVFDPILRNIFGQKKSTISIPKIMNEGKILLVNLAKGTMAEANSKFLGMFLMAKILSSAMERVKLPEKKRKLVCLYVDEFQNLATENFLILLSEGRKFGLSLVLANQFVTQIKDTRIIDAIFGNVGNMIAFRTGKKDADILAPHFLPVFTEHDLTNLPNWQACLKTSVKGQQYPPYTLQTLKPEPAIANNHLEDILNQQHSQYARPRKEVEKEIAEGLESSK